MMNDAGSTSWGGGGPSGPPQREQQREQQRGQQRGQQRSRSRSRARTEAEEAGERERGDGEVTDGWEGWLWEGVHRDKRQRCKNDKRQQRPCALCGVLCRHVCSGCRAMNYCSREHQRLHWVGGHVHMCSREYPRPDAV